MKELNYKFKYVSMDNYLLEYTNINGEEKQLPFRRTIALAQKLQGMVANARIKMFKELTSQGITKDDLIIKRKSENGSIIYDETNYKEFEKSFLETEATITMNEIVEECFKMNIADLLTDIGIDINDPSEISRVALFSTKFQTVINGTFEEENSPSTDNKEPIPGNKSEITQNNI